MNNVVVITKECDINLSNCIDIYYDEEENEIIFSSQKHTITIYTNENEEDCVNKIRKSIRRAYMIESKTPIVIDIREYEESK